MTVKKYPIPASALRRTYLSNDEYQRLYTQSIEQPDNF